MSNPGSNRTGGSNVEMNEETRLRMEFQAIDANNDGRVDRDEMDAYLAQQGIDEEHRIQIVDELFDKCDKDGNNRIDLDEFTTLYVQTKNQLVERETEIKQSIIVNNNRLKEAREQLEEAKRKHGNYISGPMGVLHITVVRAENLGQSVNNSHVVCYQGNKHGHTRPGKGQNPEYTENEISFEVDDDQIPVNVQVVDIDRGVQLIQSEISFDEIK